ncbi:MAG: hypothetical protein WAU02_03760 [Candidatus Saccharimonadales bacterium]
MEANNKAITGLKKRQQISQANRIVFIWVAIAAAIVTIALVMTQFMVKQFLYNNKVHGKLVETNATLTKNIAAYEPLKTDVTQLVADQQLTRLRVDPKDNALQVIIDAMPTVDDRIGLAASLQQIVLTQSGAKIDNIGFVDQQTAGATAPVNVPVGVVPITFSFTATGPYNTIKALFERVRHSIRPINIVSIKISGSASLMKAEVQAMTYYAQPKTIEMKKEKVSL